MEPKIITLTPSDVDLIRSITMANGKKPKLNIELALKLINLSSSILYIKSQDKTPNHDMLYLTLPTVSKRIKDKGVVIRNNGYFSVPLGYLYSMGGNSISKRRAQLMVKLRII